MRSTRKGLRLNQILLHVRDVERSRRFYTEKLGFKVRHDFSPEYVAIVTPNNIQIGLHPRKDRQSKQTNTAQHASIEFDVDNVDVWYKRLKERGVKFTEKPRDEWGEREARFKDPDGYGLAISSPSQKSEK